MIDPSAHYRSVELSKMRQYMKYTAKDYAEDWETAIALAKMMAIQGRLRHLETLLDSCFMRISAFSANNPGSMPWEEK